MNRPPRAPDAFAAENTQSAPFLRVYIDGVFTRNHIIKEGTWIVGRGLEADIRLEGKYVSRRHFQLEYSGAAQILVQDLNSHNGTFVNGQKVIRAALGHGDEIRIGEVRMVLSHRTFSKPNVIPFPNVKTETQIDLARLQGRVEVPVPPPRREIPKPAPRVQPPTFAQRALSGIVILGAAMTIAWFMNRLTKKSGDTILISERTQNPPRNQYRVPRILAPIEPLIRKGLEPVKEARPRREAKTRPPEPRQPLPPPQPKRNELVDSLKNSLRELSSGDLGDIDTKSLSSRSRSDSNLVGLKKFSREGTTLDVEVELPRFDETKAKEDKRMFDPRQYQAMLRSRIEGIEQCYYDHVKSARPGKVTVWFTIGASGEVKKSGIESSTIPSKNFQSCIVNRISKLQFDPPPFDGFTVTYGFRFGTRKVRF